MKEDDNFKAILTVIFFIFLGIPVWYKTTAVKRADLPFNEILNWKKNNFIDINLKNTINLNFHNDLEFKSTSVVEKSLNNIFSSFFESSHLKNNSTNSKTVVRGKLSFILNSFTKGFYKNKKSLNNKELSNFFVNQKPTSKNGNYEIEIFCFKKENDSEEVFISNKRLTLLNLKKTNCLDEEYLSSVLIQIISSLFSDEQNDFIQNEIDEKVTKNDLSNMRTIKYSPEYQVTFSLLVGEPSSLMVDWDIEQAIDSYLSPFVQFIKSVTNLTISSQILLHTSLPIKPIKLFLDGKDAFILTPKELPHFINSAEWNFASVVNSFPPLNFLLYVPSLEESPLYLTRTDHTLLSTNAFLIPRWGGIIVANPILPINDAHNTKKKVLLKEIAMKNYIEIYLQQLRSLLGIRRCWTDSNFLSKSIKVEYENSLNGITLNELDRWTRKISLSNLEDTVNTLGSLMVLIEEIDGMVVEDKIRDYVLISLDSIKKLYENLEKMNYNEANYLSQIGIQYSEKAFFDKSLVSMLYFPTEHKYAVYLPFFLPALMPVFKSLISSLKSMKKKWKEKKEIDRKKKNM